MDNNRKFDYKIYDSGVIDILERGEQPVIANVQKLIQDQNTLLLQIARELHRLRPDVLLQNYVQCNRTDKWLVDQGDYWDIQFLYNGRKVRSLYTLILGMFDSNEVSVTINGQSVIQPTTNGFGSYGQLPYYSGPIVIDAEIDSLRLTKFASINTAVSLTNFTDVSSLPPSPATNAVNFSVYAWGSLADFEDVFRLPSL